MFTLTLFLRAYKIIYEQMDWGIDKIYKMKANIEKHQNGVKYPNITCKHIVKVCLKGISLFIARCFSVTTFKDSQFVNLCKLMSPKQIMGPRPRGSDQWFLPYEPLKWIIVNLLTLVTCRVNVRVPALFLS